MMKIMKRQFVIIGIVVLVLVAGAVAAFAASQYSTPAEAVAGLTGRDLQSVIDEHAETGKTYGTIASEAGVLDDFRAEMLVMKKDALAARVADGRLTQGQADAIMANIESRQATCDGSRAVSGLHGTGCGAGAGFGLGQGHKQSQGNHGSAQGSGLGRGNGGNGHGMGRGQHHGSCIN